MTQKDFILQELKKGEWVGLDLALQNQIYRLSERIREIRKEGYEIESRRKQGKSYQEYRLKSENLVLLKDKNEGKSLSNSSIREAEIVKSMEIDERISEKKVERNLLHLRTSLPL